MANDIVNEGSTSYLTTTFLNKAGSQEAPVSATWQAHDVDSGEELQAETAIAPIAAQVEITLSPDINQIVNAAKAFERRRITIKGSYGISDAVNSQYEYSVKNLSKVT